MNTLKKLSWPFLFVLMWSTGPVATKQALIDASPMMIMFGRYLLAFLILFVIVLLSRKNNIPKGRAFVHSAVSGLLIHFIFVGSVFLAVNGGVSATLSGLINGFQPIAVLFFGVFMLGESISVKKVVGMSFALVGLIIFVSFASNQADTPIPIRMILLYLVGVSSLAMGMVYQKKYCSGIAIIENTMIQSLSSTCAFALALWLLGDYRLNVTPEFVFTFLWLVMVISVAAILILAYLINTNQVSNVSTLFYLTPLVSAFFSRWIFDEVMNSYQWVGMALVITGIIFVMLEFKRKKQVLSVVR